VIIFLRLQVISQIEPKSIYISRNYFIDYGPNEHNIYYYYFKLINNYIYNNKQQHVAE